MDTPSTPGRGRSALAGGGPSEADETGGRGDPADSPTVAVPVVAVVVAPAGAEGLEETLGSLAGQDHGSLSVLVLVGGPTEELAERVARILPSAYLSRVDDASSFPDAANAVIESVEGAVYLLFVGCGVVLDPSAVRLLVEEAYRSNAGIAGPKVVALERPEVILEVGMAIDHYGVAFTGIEPGEIDQEQHDAVRDVFFVSSTAMLVRADLFRELGGFDPAASPGVHDLDLCWRARLMGARVLAVPDARVRQRRAAHSAEVTQVQSTEARRVSANRLRTLLKCYSGLALVWVLPSAFVLSIVESVGYVLTRRPAKAGDVAAAWASNVRDLPATIRARREAQRERRVGDNEVRTLMIRGSARIRAYSQGRLHTGDRLQEASLTAARAAERARVRLSHPEAILAVAGLIVLLVGSRSLLFDRVPEVGQLVRWPAVGDLFSTYWSSWRFSGLGSQSPPAAAFGFLTGGGAALLGAVGAARTIVVVGALPLGAFGAYRLARPLSASAVPAIAAAVAYAANPLPRNLVAGARLGALVTYALAPFVAAAVFADAGGGRFGFKGLKTPLRPLLVLGVLTAIVAAMWPPGLLLAPLFALALVLAVPLVGGWSLAAGGLDASLRGTLVGFVLLLPWPWILTDPDAAALGLIPRRVYDLGDLLGFAVGPHGGGGAVIGLYAAAALPLVVADGARLAWTARAWMLMLVSFALAWVPSRVDAGLAVPDSGALLVPAAVGLALAVGLGTAVFVEDLRRTLFGWRQFLAAAAVLGVLVPVLPLLASTLDGDWALPNRDWHESLEWMDGEAQTSGRFRVLWLGDPEVLPLDARVSHDIGWGMSRDGYPDARDLFVAPSSDATPVLEQAIGLAASGRTARLGRLVAPMGVRYVALLERAAPTSKQTRPADPLLRDTLSEQLDLAQVESEPGLDLYQNEAWAPSLAVLPPDLANEAPDGEDVDPTSAALRADVTGAEPVLGPRDSTEPAGPGRLLWAESSDDGWRASADGERLERLDTFGWSNGWDVDEEAELSVTYEGGLLRPALLLLQAGLWLAVIVVLVRRRDARQEAPA